MSIPKLRDFSTLVSSDDRFESKVPVSYQNRISYTNRDIASVRKKILDTIPELTREWTDFSESDIGVALIETLSGVADFLNFYLDNQALETYYSTARQRKNMKAQLALLGQSLSMTSSAIGTAKFVLTEPWWEDIVIPVDTDLVTTEFSNAIHYVTTKEAVIPAGSLEVEVPIMQGQLIVHKLKVSEFRNMNSQMFYLQGKDTAINSVKITMDGKDWTEVPDVFLKTEGGEFFSVFEDKNDKAYIMMSYNYLDVLPINRDAIIEISYLNSLGKEGNVAFGAVNRINSKIVDLEGNTVNNKLVVHNTERTTGGASREDIEHSRKYAVDKIKTMQAAVTLKDYNTYIKSYPGVEKAIALDWSVPGDYVTVPYIVKAYVVPVGGGEPSKEFLKSIENFMNSIRIISTRVELYSAVYKPVDIDVDIYTSIPYSEFEALRIKTEDLLKEYFLPENQEFSKGVRPSNLTTLIQNSSQDIDYITLNSPSGSFNLKKTEFPTLGELKVSIHATR